MSFFDISDITLTHISTVCHVAPGTGKPKHTNRTFHGIVFYPDNSCTFSFDSGESIVTAAGSVVYLPKHSCYRVITQSTHSGCYAINFDTLEDINLPPQIFVSKNPSKLRSLFVGAENMWRTKPAGYMHGCKSAFYSILELINHENRAYVPSSKKARLEPAVKYISENYTDCDISTDILHSMCGISPAYFRRLFCEAYGMPPVKYINSLRVAHARELLLSDMHTTGDISALCGFRDECYFRRVFKAETGCSPGRFLKSFK